MDEPFGVLDADARSYMQELLLDIIAPSETTVLLVTHDIAEAVFPGGRIVFVTRHPGTVCDNIITELTGGKRVPNKEGADGANRFSRARTALHAPDA